MNFYKPQELIICVETMERIRQIENYLLQGNKIKWNHEPYDILPECYEKRLDVIFNQILPDIAEDIRIYKKAADEVKFRIDFIEYLKASAYELIRGQDTYTREDVDNAFIEIYGRIIKNVED